jgi:hypothetical protein
MGVVKGNIGRWEGLKGMKGNREMGGLEGMGEG